MAYIVTESCINCKHQDCVEICPVDCFYEGENFVVINPNECIDCGICETECPVDAIKHHEDCDRKWVSINVAASKVWPNITTKGEVPADAEHWATVKDKLDLLSRKGARRDPVD